MGWFYGFKFHIAVNDKGELLDFVVTQANVDDRTPLKSGNFLEKVFGSLYADKGYISKELASLLFDQGLHLKARWEVEIFFREIKQLLHIKSFIGTSENAVMIQIWTALITILVLKALKAMAKHQWYLSNLVAFIRLNLFVKVELQKWLDYPFRTIPRPTKR